MAVRHPHGSSVADGSKEEKSQVELCSQNYRLEYDAFSRFIEGRPIPLWSLCVLAAKSCLALFEMLIRYIPGGFGYKIRYYYYKLFLKRLGKDVLIDVGVTLNGAKNISIGDYCWIDAYCRIDAMLGEVTLGKRIHIAPYAIVAARAPVTIGDYCGIGAACKIYSNSETPGDGKRLSGPMIPEKYKGFHSKPIVVERDCLVGANSILLPGAELGEGAVVGPNSVVNKRIEPWTVVASSPARIVGRRSPVTVPEL